MSSFPYIGELSDPSGYAASATSVAVSADGSVLVIGLAALESVATFDKVGAEWVLRGGLLEAADKVVGDYFGASVALSADGSILAVGATRWEGTATNQGGVYVFDWSGSAWVQRGAVLISLWVGSLEEFGTDVALSGDGGVLAVSQKGMGTYTFAWTGSAWTARQATPVSGLSAATLSADGWVLVTGMATYTGSLSSQGAAYTYDWSGSAWVQRGSLLVASNPVANGYFGDDVALSSDGNTLAIGAYGGSATNPDYGTVYVYDRDGAAWAQREQIILPSPYVDDAFGYSVALTADASNMVVGENGYLGSGAVYFLGAPSIPPSFWTNLFGQREVA